MKHIISGIIYAISYFTILPIRVNHFDANKQFYKGVLVGLILVGLILASIVGVFHIGFSYIVPSWYAAIFTSILYLFLYGFLHLEALADTIDGWFASLSKKDVYEVMHEPQIGAIGAIGAFCFVLLKILALTYLLIHLEYIAIIIIFMLSRISVLFALQFSFHKKSYFVLALKNSYKTSILLKIIFLPLNLLTKFILNKLKKQLGFLNGDTLGFTIELIELILLNIAVIISIY